MASKGNLVSRGQETFTGPQRRLVRLPQGKVSLGSAASSTGDLGQNFGLQIRAVALAPMPENCCVIREAGSPSPQTAHNSILHWHRGFLDKQGHLPNLGSSPPRSWERSTPCLCLESWPSLALRGSFSYLEHSLSC